MAEAILKEYDAKLDDKKRVTLRGVPHSYFNVKVYKTGKVVLAPRILVDPNIIPKSTLKIIDNSAKNLKKGKVSKPVNLSKYK